MSFTTELYTVMTSNIQINNLVNEIYYENLPDNFDIKDNWIVYTITEDDAVSTLKTKRILSIYKLYIKALCTSSETLDTLSNLIIDYLVNYSTSTIMDIDFMTNGHTVDLEKGVYMNNLEFQVIYKN